jgi:hypothetical protein
MYNTSKRIIAFILLLGQLLTTTSCSGNFSIPTEPKIAHEHKKLDKKLSQTDALVPLANKEVGVDEPLADQLPLEGNREASPLNSVYSAAPIPITVNKNQSLVSSHAKTAPRIVRPTGDSIKPTRNKANRGIDFARNQVKGKQRQAQELVSVASNMTTPTVEQSVTEHSLIAKGGHKIQLKKQDDSWVAIVQEHAPQGFSRTLYVDVYLAPGFTTKALSKHSLAWQEVHTAVIFPEKSSNGKGYVYIGEGGLLGGEKQQGCDYGPNDRRRDPDNPSRWVCPGPGKHPRTPPPAAPSSSSSSSSSSRPSTSSSSFFRPSSSSTSSSSRPYTPSFPSFRVPFMDTPHQPAKPTYQDEDEDDEEQEAVRRAEDFDRFCRQANYDWECRIRKRAHNQVYKSEIKIIKDQIFNQSKKIIDRSGSYTYNWGGIKNMESVNKEKKLIREIEDLKITIPDAICKIQKLEQNLRRKDVKRKVRVAEQGRVVTYCTEDLYELEKQMDDILDRVRDNSGPTRLRMNAECHNRKKTVDITDEDIRSINKELEEPLKRIRRIIEEETKSTLIIEECYDIRRKLHDLIQRVKTFKLDQKARGTLKKLEELDQEFKQKIKEEKHKIFVKGVEESIQTEGVKLKQLIREKSGPWVIIEEAYRSKNRLRLMRGRLDEDQFDPYEVADIINNSIRAIGQITKEQKARAIQRAASQEEKWALKDKIRSIKTKLEIEKLKVKLEQYQAGLEKHQKTKIACNERVIELKEMIKEYEGHLAHSRSKDHPIEDIGYHQRKLNEAKELLKHTQYRLTVVESLVKNCTEELKQTQQKLSKVEEEESRKAAALKKAKQIKAFYAESAIKQKEPLEAALKEFLEVCQGNASFNEKREELMAAEESLKEDPENEALQALKAENLANFQNDPLYLQAKEIGVEAAGLRREMEERATDIRIEAAEIGYNISAGISKAKAYQKEADEVRDDIINKLRELLGCTYTPRVGKRVAEGLKGFAESFYDTGKAFTVDLPVLLGKLGLKGVESLVKWEDKLGIKEGWTNLGKACKVLLDDTMQEWEEPADYQIRILAIKEVKRKHDLYRRAFDAENYHLGQDRALGYVSAEMIQFLFGGEILKGATKGATKGAQFIKKIQQGTKAEKVVVGGARVGAKLTRAQVKSISSLERQIAKHEAKLAEYIKDPMKFDNKGFLKSAPNEAVRQKIIQSRVNHLQQEINTFRDSIQKIINGK